jgi:polar amino acid transport system substrate-binding protein
VAGVAGTSGKDLLGAQGFRPRSYPFVIQACKALLRGEVDAVVHNKAILDYMIKDYGWQDLVVLPHTLLVEDYAIILPTGSELREPINRALLQAIYSPAWKTALQRYVTMAE